MDEIWINHNTTETKEWSRQLTSPGESKPKNAKVGLSANKVMAIVIWVTCGAIQINYLEKVKPITGGAVRIAFKSYRVKRRLEK